MDYFGQPEMDTKIMQEQDSVEHRVLRSLFEEESRVRGGEGERKLPIVPNEKA